MSITVDGNGKIVYTPPANQARDELSGTVVDQEFAIIDETNVLKQIQFEINPVGTNPGVVTLKVDVAGNQIIDLTNGTGDGGVTTVGPLDAQAANIEGATINGTTIYLQSADASFPGVVTAADWSTFNAKQPAGSYITDLTGDVTASGPGSAVATIPTNSVANAKLTQMAALTIKGNDTGSTADQSDLAVDQYRAMMTEPVSTLYVEQGRTDTFTPDGTTLRPFPTIMAAVNQVIANGDNAGKYYTINIAAGTYNESIDLNNSALYRITFSGSGSVNVVSATVVSCTSNNAQLVNATFQNLQLSGLADFECSATPNNIGIYATSTSFSDLTVKNAFAMHFIDCVFFGDISLENVDTFEVSQCSQSGTNLNVVTNLSNPVPYVGFPGSYIIFQGGAIVNSSTTIDALSEIQLRAGTRLGSPGGALTVDGIFEAYSSFIRSDMTFNSGATFLNHNSSWNGSLTAAGGSTITNDGSLGYTPATSGDWNSVPSEIKPALDSLAASGVAKSQTQNTVLAAPNGSNGTPSFRSLAIADLPSFDSQSPLTTKGDLLAYSTTNARLPVGTDGYVLVADSGQPTGLNWHVGAPSNPLIVDKFILNGTDISNKYVTLSQTPSIAAETMATVIGGPMQSYGNDYTVSGTTIDWNGLFLDGVLIAGDELVVEYN